MAQPSKDISPTLRDARGNPPLTPAGARALRRVLTTRDLVLLNVAAIVGLRWLSTAAKIGPSSLALWVLGLVAFFLPVAFAVLELSSRLPGEGGLYLWTKEAFGDIHAFLAGWTYWVSNLAFFPSALLFGSGVSVWLAGDRWLALADDATYNAAYCLIALWAITWLNILGLERAKWLQNAGGTATWLAGALVLLGGIVAWTRFGAATTYTPANVLPDLGTMAALTTFATIALAYSGMELGPILGGEIRDPRKRIPRAMLISGAVITAIYMAGTAALLIALPHEQIDLIGGIPQALAAIGERLGMPAFGPVTAGLVALGNLGGMSAWMAGTARLPFVVGVDRYLPPSFAALHPVHGTPHVALQVEAAITTLVLLAAVSGSTVHEAFVILIDMTLILGFLPLLYMFAALPVLRRRAAGRNEGITLVPAGAAGLWLTSALGLATTTIAVITSVGPPEDSKDPEIFLVKVVGGSLVLIAAGLALYARGRVSLRRAASG
jgi:amino acid transporter